MIETHNQQMNASYDVDKLYQEYTDYRQLVTAHVRKIIKGGNDVLVIGAGNLNDIDISVFDESKVTFVDVDKTAVINGIKRQGQKVDNFNIIKGDLTGLDTTDFFSKLEASDIESYYDFDIKIELESYDVIVVLPIYTQLLLPQLMSRLDYDALQPFLPLIQNRIEVLNGFLRSHLKNKGQMILFSDVIEYQKSQEEYNYLQAHQSHLMILEDFYESYLNTYGYGLGSYGLYEMSQHLRVVKEDFLIWPFSSDRLMLIKMDMVKTTD